MKGWLVICLIVLQSNLNALEWPLECRGNQSAGFHDAAHRAAQADAGYQPAIFKPGVFELHENLVFMQNLINEELSDVNLYLTQISIDGTESELQCRQVRAAQEATGYSCSNTPPSEMLLISEQTGNYTRTSIGGWTFHSSTENANGDSIFVEYGTCKPKQSDNN